MRVFCSKKSLALKSEVNQSAHHSNDDFLAQGFEGVGSVITLGRDSSNTIQLNDPMKRVSRHHLKFEMREQRLYLVLCNCINLPVLKSNDDEIEINSEGERLFDQDVIILPTEVSTEGKPVSGFICHISDPEASEPILGTRNKSSAMYRESLRQLYRVHYGCRRVKIPLQQRLRWLFHKMIQIVKDTGQPLCPYEEITKRAWDQPYDNDNRKKLTEEISRICKAYGSEGLLRREEDGYLLLNIDIQP